jgi:hypothetical protein
LNSLEGIKSPTFRTPMMVHSVILKTLKVAELCRRLSILMGLIALKDASEDMRCDRGQDSGSGKE